VFDDSNSLFKPEGQAAITDEFGTGFNELHPDLVLPALYAIDLIEGNFQEGGNLLPYLVEGQLSGVDEPGGD
jgi:hypothetical protein